MPTQRPTIQPTPVARETLSSTVQVLSASLALAWASRKRDENWSSMWSGAGMCSAVYPAGTVQNVQGAVGVEEAEAEAELAERALVGTADSAEVTLAEADEGEVLDADEAGAEAEADADADDRLDSPSAGAA